MNQPTMGRSIRMLRLERGMTQKALAEKLGVSDKTVSKWERDQGWPDLSLLTPIADTLGADAYHLLTGGVRPDRLVGGNLQRGSYFICPECQSLTFSTGKAKISCCGRTMKAMTPQPASEQEQFAVRRIEDDFHLQSDHEMSKAHHLSFVALVSMERLQLVKLHPEWDAQVRFPWQHQGLLLWHCNRHGLFGQKIKGWT